MHQRLVLEQLPAIVVAESGAMAQADAGGIEQQVVQLAPEFGDATAAVITG